MYVGLYRRLRCPRRRAATSTLRSSYVALAESAPSIGAILADEGVLSRASIPTPYSTTRDRRERARQHFQHRLSSFLRQTPTRRGAMDRTSLVHIAAAAGTAAVCAHGCSAARGTARLAHTATALGVSAASISPVLSGTGDVIAEKLTEDAKDILLASLNAADPRVGINEAVWCSPARHCAPPPRPRTHL